MLLVSTTDIKNDTLFWLFLQIVRKDRRFGLFTFGQMKKGLVRFLNAQNNKLLWSVREPLNFDNWDAEAINELYYHTF